MWDDFAEYILSEAGESEVRIAEIAVGKFDKIAEYLSAKDNITLIKTDIVPKDDTVIKDDITNPNLDLYRDMDMIYSKELKYHINNQNRPQQGAQVNNGN